MKITLFFLVLNGLTGQPQPATRLDSLALTLPDSLVLTRPDSVVRPAPAVQLTGELALSTGFYAMRGLEADRAQTMPWGLSGYLSLTTRSGWTIPVRLIWSSQNNQYRQPYNQVGFSPRYKKWLVLHGGYRNVTFSPLTLAGHTFLGAGVELNPGLLRVGAVAGKFNRAINADYADPDRVATFGRTGYSAKLGIGNQQNYLDLILLRVADDIHSIQTDSLTHLAPAENPVLGLSGRLQLHKKLFVELDAAGSAYTRDSRSEPLSAGRLQHLGFLSGLFTPRQSTQFYTALQTSLSYRTSQADLRLQYKRIEPDYKSMGAYYFQTDLESFTVAPTLRLFKKRLNVRTSLGWQHDNLFNQKKARTDRLIGSVSASWSSASDLTLDLLYSNYGITQRAGYRPLNDTARLAQNNRTLSGSVFKFWTGETMMHTLSGSASYQELQDLNGFTADLNENQNWNYNLSYAWQHLTTNIDLNVSYGYTRTKALDLSSVYHGPSVGIGKKFLKDNKLSFMLNVSYLSSQDMILEFDQKGSILNTALTTDYQLTPVHRLSINWTNAFNRGAQSFHEQQGTVQYSMNF